jgi:hypothetical protein
MTSKLVVGPFHKGLKTNVLPFNIDNDSFPTLINAYQWRGRVKRKRGTSLLGRLQRFFDSTNTTYGSTATITLDGNGDGNIITNFGLETNATIVIGTISLTFPIGAFHYTDIDPNTGLPNNAQLYLDGFLQPKGTINYSTGAISIPLRAGGVANATFLYNPRLPVMGLEDLELNPNENPGTLAFDTTYAYNISTTNPYPIYDVSFYKNIATGTTGYPGYIQKTNWTALWWNGEDYQQFWSTNYQGAFWATNGIEIPFTITNVGMQYKLVTNITFVAGGPDISATFTIANHGLVVGDFLFFNEFNTAVVDGLNMQTGYVTVVVDPNNVTVRFPNATFTGAGGATATGLAQYLTNRSDTTVDCIRWYDGDPTNGNPTSPTFVTGKGWVNFMPPLSNLPYSIAKLPLAQYYLVGARMIVPYKDRLLFFGPVVQTSSAGSQVYLQDTVIYSQNGTAYYTASFTGNATLATTQFNALLVPANQTAAPNSYWSDLTGYGGFITAGISQRLNTVEANEDVLICGFETLHTRLIYTGNDIVPFNFFQINSELGTASTFSSIDFDQGVMAFGNRGFVISSQTQTQRVDLDIPDQVFQVDLENNGNERMTAIRDFINEWCFFTYQSNSITNFFPDQTLFYNYRDNTWGIFNEAFTTYGNFRRRTGYTWATIGEIYPTWSSWNDPWDAGESTLLQPEIIGGNQQGFVLFREEGTNEGNSLSIQDMTGTTITSPDHCLNQGDFIVISGVNGTLDQEVNGKIFKISTVTQNTFTINPSVNSGTYLGGGVIKRMYVPFIQTKQFPTGWDLSKKTRIGAQKYLLTKTPLGQIALLIFLSQNGASSYNEGPIVPEFGSVNESLIYSTVLYTAPESTNLGLTPANTNLMTPTSTQQAQIWHRLNTSLIGDTIQLGFTMSDEQMFALDAVGDEFEITGATQADPCVLTCAGQFPAGTLIQINEVEGMTELNGNTYFVISSTSTEITIDVDATGFTAYTEGGIAQSTGFNNQFAEIELHGFILDLYQSQELV